MKRAKQAGRDAGTAAVAFGLGVASSIVADVIYDRYKDPASRRTILSSIDPAVLRDKERFHDMPTRRKTTRKTTARRDPSGSKEILRRLSKLRDEALVLRQDVLREISMGRLTESRAMSIDTEATWLVEDVAAIAAEARTAMRDRSAGRLVKDVRKALGFTRP